MPRQFSLTCKLHCCLLLPTVMWVDWVVMDDQYQYISNDLKNETFFLSHVICMIVGLQHIFSGRNNAVDWHQTYVGHNQNLQNLNMLLIISELGTVYWHFMILYHNQFEKIQITHWSVVKFFIFASVSSTVEIICLELVCWKHPRRHTYVSVSSEQVIYRGGGGIKGYH